MSSRPTRGAARLAAILDALPDPLLLVNSNGTVVDANQAAVQSLQAPGTSLVGMGVLDLLPEFDPSRIPGSMRPPASETESLDRPVRMTARRTDGTTFTVEVSGNDFTDDGTGEAHGFLSYATTDRDLLLLLVRDLTTRLGVEAELRRQHKQTEMILRAAAEGVLGVDLDGRVVLVNPAAAHILDYRASELGGRELHPLIQHSQPDGSPLALEGSALLDTLMSGRKHRVKNTVLWRKDGSPVTVDLTTAPVRDGDQLVGAVMTFTDKTRELSLNARNEHLTAVLEQELGDALGALHRRIDALAGDPAGQLWPEANWTLRRLADECRRFERLIEGVLDHQRFEAGADGGKNALELEPVGLDAVVQLAVEQAGELVGPGRVRYSVHAAAVEVAADRERLARALAHLVADVSGVTPSLEAGGGAPSLGVPALPPSGGDVPMVVLAAAQRGTVARIEVRGPARKASAVHLPIARSAVQRHGGVLQRHELPNRAGTTYVVELPLDPDAAASGPEARHVPKDTDTAMLPDLPEVAPAPDGAADGARAGGRPAAAGTPEDDRNGAAAAASGPAAGADGAPRGPIALGPGRADDASAQVPAGGQAAAPAADAAVGTGSGPGTDGAPAESQPAADAGRASRRRRKASAGEESHGALSLPGIPDPGTPVYPGLEHALPAGPPATAAATPAVQPTGRRRRLALPTDHADASEAATTVLPAVPALPPTADRPAPAAGELPGGQPGDQEAVDGTDRVAAQAAQAGPGVPGTGLAPVSGALELAGRPGPAAEPAQPRPVSSGLGELAPPRPMGGGFATTFPGAEAARPELAPAEVNGAAGANGALNGTANGTAQAPGPASGSASAELRTPPRPMAELAAAKESQPEIEAQAMVPSVDGTPRRLLVWPEPDPSTKQALTDRGYRPVIVRSREEVDAQIAGLPAALFVDPLTGPITRTALQSLRTAALNSRVPVLVTAGLGQATRDAAYGADPAVLLRALAPRDSEQHAARVLLVESDPDIAAALIASLERRGMHVEHAADENEAVARASSVQPNLVVMDLLQIRRRRVGLLDWLRANDRLYRTPLVVYTSVDLDPQELPRLRTGETVLFLAERSTTEDVQSRIVDLLTRIGAMGEMSVAGGVPQAG
ncbi:hybrid sensor histidine kinase/response regulator [Kitasatospora terrestris]|uniref:PAS domain S-box protein n=1 Tax=Kitasatospora terrestris TaxID=258051 RepID=A0ABP9DVY6_9ACTN